MPCNNGSVNNPFGLSQSVRPLDPDTGYPLPSNQIPPCDRFKCRPNEPLPEHLHITRSILFNLQRKRLLQSLQSSEEYHAKKAYDIRKQRTCGVNSSVKRRQLVLSGVNPSESTKLLTVKKFSKQVKIKKFPKRPGIFNKMDADDLLTKKPVKCGLYGDDPYWAPEVKERVVKPDYDKVRMRKKVTLPIAFKMTKKDECVTRVNALCELERTEFPEVVPRIRVNIPNFKLLHKNEEWQFAGRKQLPLTVVKPFKFVERDEKAFRVKKLEKRPLIPRMSALQRLHKCVLDKKNYNAAAANIIMLRK